VRNLNHPKNKDSRVGPFPSFAGDGWGQKKLDLEDSKLVRLEPGEKSEMKYVFRIKLMRWSSGRSDVRNMKVFLAVLDQSGLSQVLVDARGRCQRKSLARQYSRDSETARICELKT
jgi:hypothetical protein